MFICTVCKLLDRSKNSINEIQRSVEIIKKKNLTVFGLLRESKREMTGDGVSTVRHFFFDDWDLLRKLREQTTANFISKLAGFILGIDDERA